MKIYMILVGLCGKKFAGKDTMADYLVAHHGFYKKSFAGPLKEACRHLFLLSDNQCHNPRFKDVIDPRWNVSPRALFQIVGTDWVRNQFHTNFWVERMRHELATVPPGIRIVISDVRFENEKNLVLDYGGHVCGLERVPCFGRKDAHESETNMDSFFDSLHVLHNNSSVEQFYKKIDTYLHDVVQIL